MTEFIDELREHLGDRYRVDREAGRGRMATVFRAHDLKHDRDVALKGHGEPEQPAGLSLSPAWLKIDPLFKPLRGNPRFEKLVAGA